MKNLHEVDEGGNIVVFLSHKGLRLPCYIDPEDMPRVFGISGTWAAKWNPTARCYYARYQYGGRKNIKTVYMHRYILGVEDPNVIIDHDDHNGLNNTRRNMKVSDVPSNGFNRRSHQSNSLSKKRNVYWNKREQKYMVWLVFMKKKYYIGYFEHIEEADIAAKKLRLELTGKEN